MAFAAASTAFIEDVSAKEVEAVVGAEAAAVVEMAAAEATAVAATVEAEEEKDGGNAIVIGVTEAAVAESPAVETVAAAAAAAAEEAEATTQIETGGEIFIATADSPPIEDRVEVDSTSSNESFEHLNPEPLTEEDETAAAAAAAAAAATAAASAPTTWVSAWATERAASPEIASLKLSMAEPGLTAEPTDGIVKSVFTISLSPTPESQNNYNNSYNNNNNGAGGNSRQKVRRELSSSGIQWKSVAVSGPTEGFAEYEIVTAAAAEEAAAAGEAAEAEGGVGGADFKSVNVAETKKHLVETPDDGKESSV